MPNRFKKITTLSFSVLLMGFLAAGVEAAVQSNSTISPNPAQANASVQIQINASDSAGAILIIDLYINGGFRGDSYDCTQGTNNPVDTCTAQFTKQFSPSGTYRISGGILTSSGVITDVPETILTVTETGAPPAPSPGGPTITGITPNPAQINTIINIAGPNFCSNIDFNISNITVIFDQTAVPGGTSVSAPPTTPASTCELLKVDVPSSLLAGNVAKVFVRNTGGTSNSIDLSLLAPPPPGTNTPSPIPSDDTFPARTLEVAWPPSPLGTRLTGESLTNLIKYLYEWGIGLGGFLAFIALIIAGFQYLTSVGNAGKMGDAMKRMQSAGLGLVLLLGSFLILNTINPQLTDISMPPPEQIRQGNWNFNLEGQQISRSTTPTCQTVKLYPDSNLQGTPLTRGVGEYKNIEEVESMLIYGGCSVTLYDYPECTQNAFGPYPSINQKSDDSTPYKNIETGGVTSFGCISVSQMR